MTGIEVAFLGLVILAFIVFGVSLYIVDRRCNPPKRQRAVEGRGSRPAAQQTLSAAPAAPPHDRPQEA